MKVINCYEVGIQAQAADIKFTLVGLPGCGGEYKSWVLFIVDTAPDEIYDGAPRSKIVLLDHNQASAIMALFTGELSNAELNTAIYSIAEPALVGVAHNLRPIP